MQWSPPALVPAGLATAGVALGTTALLLDPAGRVLVGGAAVLLLALAVRETLLRPRLAARPDGVELRTLTGRRLLPWELLRVQVRTARRWGTTVRTLELDAWPPAGEEDLLVVLGRWELGADPREVARALDAVRGSGSRGGPR